MYLKGALLILTLTVVSGSVLPNHPANVTADKASNSADESYPIEDDGITGKQDRRLTENNVKSIMLRELVKFIQGKENVAVVNDIVQKKEYKKRNCSIKYGPNYYYDSVVGDCRNCLDRDCHKNEICTWECKDILKTKGLQEEIEVTKQELEKFESKVTVLQNGNDSFIIWNSILTILVVILLLALGFLAHLYINLRRKLSMKAVQARYDVEVDKLIPAVQESASTLASDSTEI